MSDVYLGKGFKLKFRCKDGHEWETLPDVILNGHWCPECAPKLRGKNRRLTIAEMDQIAETRGGHCLSSEYINANTPLLWECEKKPSVAGYT